MYSQSGTQNQKQKHNMATTNSLQIASQIAEIVLNKGVAFAGFDYNRHRRNVTVGSNLRAAGFSGGGNGSRKGNWGKTFTHGSLVAYKGKLFLQAVENNRGNKQLKRFDIAKVSNFVIG
jgi:hypothetical protein